MSLTFTTFSDQSKNVEFLQKYNLGKVLATESTSVIYMCTKIDTQEECVAKLSKIDSQTKQDFTKQTFEMAKTLDHYAIIKTLHYFENDDTMCLVTEYCENGDLLDFLNAKGPIREKTVKKIMKQLLDAIDYLHNKNLVHQDIKLENICLNKDNNIKLIDFEFCIRDDDKVKKKDLRGTAAYCSPEKINKTRYTKGLGSDKPADMWAAGVAMFALLVRDFPFEDDTDLYYNIRKQLIRYDGACWAYKSEDAIDLVKRMLTRDVAKRITVKDALNHSYFFANRDD